jgi:hypothetical protein
MYSREQLKEMKAEYEAWTAQIAEKGLKVIFNHYRAHKNYLLPCGEIFEGPDEIVATSCILYDDSQQKYENLHFISRGYTIRKKLRKDLQNKFVGRYWALKRAWTVPVNEGFFLAFRQDSLSEHNGLSVTDNLLNLTEREFRQLKGIEHSLQNQFAKGLQILEKEFATGIK